jgi:hypothetical protein
LDKVDRMQRQMEQLQQQMKQVKSELIEAIADFLAVRWRLSLRGTANLTEGKCPKAISI